jgi:hypothetical protein
MIHQVYLIVFLLTSIVGAERYYQLYVKRQPDLKSKLTSNLQVAYMPDWRVDERLLTKRTWLLSSLATFTLVFAMMATVSTLMTAMTGVDLDVLSQSQKVQYLREPLFDALTVGLTGAALWFYAGILYAVFTNRADVLELDMNEASYILSLEK